VTAWVQSIFRHISGVCEVSCVQSVWSKMPMRAGMCLEESHPRQRTITKKILAWDDVIRPDRIIICSDWPTILKWDNAFEYIKGDEGKNDRQTEDE